MPPIHFKHTHQSPGNGRAVGRRGNKSGNRTARFQRKIDGVDHRPVFHGHQLGICFVIGFLEELRQIAFGDRTHQVFTSGDVLDHVLTGVIRFGSKAGDRVCHVHNRALFEGLDHSPRNRLARLLVCNHPCNRTARNQVEINVGGVRIRKHFYKRGLSRVPHIVVKLSVESACGRKHRVPSRTNLDEILAIFIGSCFSQRAMVRSCEDSVGKYGNSGIGNRRTIHRIDYHPTDGAGRTQRKSDIFNGIGCFHLY